MLNCHWSTNGSFCFPRGLDKISADLDRVRKKKCEVATLATYMSFLIRMWQEPHPHPPETDSDWHSKVEHIQSSRQWTFGTLEELQDFLQQVSENPELLTHCDT